MSVLAQPIGLDRPPMAARARSCRPSFRAGRAYCARLAVTAIACRGKTFSACAVIEQMDHVLGASGTASVAAAQNMSFTNA